MSTLTITNSFSTGDGVDATKFTTNFNDIATAVNASALDDDNISSLSENKVVFNGAGHDHSGTTNGSTLPGSSVAKATGTTQGTIKYLNGTTTIPKFTVGDDTSGIVTVSFAGAFSLPPVVQLLTDDAVIGLTTSGLNTDRVILKLTANEFVAGNISLTAKEVQWQAIGV